MNLRDTYNNDPRFFDAIDADYEDVTEYTKQERKQMADEDKAAMMKEDGDMLRQDWLEPLTSDEAFQYFQSKNN